MTDCVTDPAAGRGAELARAAAGAARALARILVRFAWIVLTGAEGLRARRYPHSHPSNRDPGSPWLPSGPEQFFSGYHLPGGRPVGVHDRLGIAGLLPWIDYFSLLPRFKFPPLCGDRKGAVLCLFLLLLLLPPFLLQLRQFPALEAITFFYDPCRNRSMRSLRHGGLSTIGS